MTVRSRPISRRAVLAAAALASATGARAATLIPVTVVAGNTLSVSSLELINASTGGHFRAAGLDAQLVAAGTGVAAMQQLVAGRCQFARANSLDVIQAVSRQNAPLVVVAGLEHEASYMVVSAAAAPVPSAEALAGKRIGILGVGSNTDIFLDLLLAHAGIERTGIVRQVVSIGPAAFVPVRQGQLDAVLLPKEMTAALVGAGEKIVAWSIKRYIHVPGRSYVTTRDVLDTKADLALAFLRAISASVQEVIAGPVEPLLARATAQFGMPNLTLSLVREIVADDVASWLDDGSETLLRSMPGVWKSARDVLAAARLAVIEDETRLYTNSLIERVLAR